MPRLREVPGPGYCRIFWTAILIIALDSETVALLIEVLRVEAFDRLGRLAGRRECHTESCIDIEPFIVIVELVDHTEEKWCLTNYEGAKSFVVSEGADIMSGGFPLGREVLSGSG